MSQFDESGCLVFPVESMYANQLYHQSLPSYQLSGGTHSLWYDQTFETSIFPSLLPFARVGQHCIPHESNDAQHEASSEVAMVSSPEMLHYPSSSNQSLVGRSNRTNVPLSSMPSQVPATKKPRRSKGVSMAAAPTRVQKVSSRRRIGSSKTVARPWPRRILVCAKNLSDEPVKEFLYFMVVLHSTDVQACGTAICCKLGIHSVGHKSMMWKDKSSCCQGPVDTTFLGGLNEMQDFVVDVVGAGDDGYVELLLEM